MCNPQPRRRRWPGKRYVCRSPAWRLLIPVCFLIASCTYVYEDSGASPSIPAPELVKIEGGVFTMGLPRENDYADNAIRHEVFISPFYIGEYEITQKQFYSLMGFNPASQLQPDLPVDYISWYDALQYCNALSALQGFTPVYVIDGTSVSWDANADGYRLPTEAEWEYACRGGTTTFWNVGEISYENLWSFANYDSGILDPTYGYPYSPGVIVMGGSYRPNAYGLYDIMGNVYEWCWDWFGQYHAGFQTDPAGPETGIYRVLRGGCYLTKARSIRSGNRDFGRQWARSKGNGFRVARSVQK